MWFCTNKLSQVFKVSLLSSLFLVQTLQISACARKDPPSWQGDQSSWPLSSSPGKNSFLAPSLSASSFSSLNTKAQGPNEKPAEVGKSENALPSPASVQNTEQTETKLKQEASLPQTHDMPNTEEAFQKRASALFEAIKEDNPELAVSFFFPLEAYKQVKDVSNPERDWKARLLAEYKHDIHELARENKRHLNDAEYIKLDVESSRAKWVLPSEEYNKIGYYRVFGSKLSYKTKEGRLRTIEVKSLISWRGEWFCVHLSAINRAKAKSEEK